MFLMCWSGLCYYILVSFFYQLDMKSMDQVLCKMTAAQHRQGLSCASSSILMFLILPQNKRDSNFPGQLIFA